MKITMKATLQAAFTGVALGMIPVVQVTHAQQVVDPAAAAGKQSTITQSLNGAPVQNIAAPNASGLSHNQFSTFNVGTQGLVINNSAVNAVSNIGGAVIANPHLAGGEARLILNEVTSGNRSILQGTQELLGGRAAYILANPNGISCDGCGFVNFPRATLTTGSPVFQNGALTGFGVTGGDVLVGPGGLNATGVDYFDIITRSAVINGQVNANDLSLRLGAADVDYASLAATSRAAGNVPVFALDSSALGGMYAGRISLVGTEAGVGVRMLGNMAASVSDIELDVNGKISFKDNLFSAQRDLKVASTAGNEVELLNAQLSAGRNASVSGGDVSQQGGKLTAAGDVALNTPQLNGTGGLIEAGQDLIVNASGAVTLSGGTVQAARDLTLDATSLAISNSAKLMGESDKAGATVGTTSVTVTGALNLNNAALFSGGALDVNAGSITVDAASNANGALGLRGTGAVDINTGTLSNSGLVASDSTLTVGATTVTNDGKLYGKTGLQVAANTLTNRNVIESGAGMGLNVRTLSNDASTRTAEIYAVGSLSVTGNHQLDNVSSASHIARMVARDGALSIDSRTGNVATQQVRNRGGLLFGGAGMTVLVANRIDNIQHNGRRGTIFANNGNMLLGALNQAALTASVQDVIVNNVDADIESRVGDVTIYASILHNTTGSVPAVAEGTWTRRTGWYDHDNNPATPAIEVFANCGTYDDHFDKDVVGKICGRWYEDRSQTLAIDNTPRGRIIAGNDFTTWIEKEALNYISLISAGRNITINGATDASFENRAVELRHERNALVYLYEDGGREWNPAGGCYTDGRYNRCFHDTFDRKKQFTNVSPGIVTHYTVGMASTVQAAGSINVNIGRVANNSGVSGESANTPKVPGLSPSTGTPGGAPGTIGTLTGSPFFIPSSNPTSPYLFETDPRLMSLEGLYGSDMFLNSLGLDPTKYLRAGDPYFEQQLLRQQLLAEAGQIFIADGLAGENEQFKYLMDNALAAQDDMQLRVGVALTKEQIANLQKDIVWMVETEVQGKKVLVPQLYLSDVTKAKLAEGARFVAANINVKTEGAVTNSGAFVASNDIKIDAGTTFTNSQGTLVAANGLSIEATGDILNQSGTIRGGDVSLTSKEGSIVNETLTQDVQFGKAGTVTLLGQTATIESTGSLNLDAAKDIVSRGGDVSAGGDATLKAGNDITFTAIERQTFTNEVTSSSEGGFRTTTVTTTNSTSQVGSNLIVGGDLTATAARDINIEASNVDVAGGGSLDAGRDLNIRALAETEKTVETTATRSWNTSFEQDTTIDRTTGAASSLNFGGDLKISSGNDTNIVGSQIAVAGDLNVEKIGGDLNISTFEEKTTVSQTTTTSSFFGGSAKAEAGDNITESQATASATLYSRSKETLDIDSTTHLRSGIAVGGDLNAGGDAIKGDVNITGSNIATGGDLNLAAGGNINILAAEDKTTVTQTSESFSLNVSTSASIDGASAGIGAQYDESSGSATQTTAQVSGLSAGGNIDINAGGNFTEQGTQVAAGGDIKVEADSITSLAAQNTYTETGETLSVSVGIGVKAETGLGGVVGAFVDDKTNKAGFDMAAASGSLNGLSVPDAGSVSVELSVSVNKTTTSSSGNDAVASGFSSGGNTTFKAREGDATFHGTQVEAGGSIDVTADKGSVKILTADSSSQSKRTETDASVTIGVSGDGTISGSGSGSEKTESSGSTSQQAASFKAGKDVNITAEKDVTLVGTTIEAKDTASIEAREGKIDFLAARDTTTASSSEVSANASFSANVTGKEGSIGGGGGTMDTSENSSTGKAGSISGGNIVLKSKGDITLEGTNVAAAESATINTEGKLDFKAVESTYERTAKGASAQVDIEAGATGGGAKVAASSTDEHEKGVTRTGGSLSAKNLTINAGSGARLEGTQVNVSENASIDTGKGALVIESAVSTYTQKINNTDVEVGAKGDAKEGSGQGSFKMQGAYEDTNKVSNQNATLNIGGKADIKAAGGIQIAGANIEGVGSVIKAGETNLNGAQVSIAQRQDVDESTKTNVGVSVGVIVPSKKARQEVSDTVQKVRDSDAANTLRNKVGNATTAVSNAADSAKTRLSNLGGDDASKAKAQTDLAQRQQDRKDANTADKLANNTAQADRNAARQNASIDADLAKKNQKADFDRQKADDQAASNRDKELARLGPNATQADKDGVQTRFEKAQQDNAQAASDSKIANASTAADQRSEVIRRQGADKLGAETKAADSTIRHHDDNGAVQVAMAAPTGDARRDAEVRKTDDIGKLQADKAAREATVKADTDKALADSAAQKARTDADLSAQKTADADALKARQEQARKDAAVDRDSSLSADQKTAQKEQNAKQAQADVEKANQKLADQKQANAEAQSQSQLTAREKLDQARIDSEKRKQELLADTAMKRDLLVPDQKVRDAMAKADTEQKGKVQAADQKRSDADKAAQAAFDQKKQTIEARKDLDAAQKKAEVSKAAQDAEAAKAKAKTERDQAVTQAQTERDADPAIVKAKDDQKTALEQRKQAQIDQAAAAAKHKEAVAQLDATERKAQEQADRKAEREQTRIDRDDSLSADQKAQALKKAADDRANEREQATKKHADDVQAKEASRDAADRKAAVDALDPGLSAADKAAKTKEIDKTFDDRKTAREQQRDDAVAAAAEQKKNAQDTAQADLVQRQAQAKADADRKAAENTAKTTHDTEVAKVDQKLAADKAGKTVDEVKALEKQAAKDKNELARQRDARLADGQQNAATERATADANRSRKEAELAQAREQKALDAITPKPADYDARKQAIDDRATAAKKKADDNLSAQTRDFKATADEKKALADRTKRDADIDADTSLTAQQKERQKQDSEKSFQTAQKTAQGEHDAAKKAMDALLTPAEKAAADAAAEKAEKAGERVKNPYALSARLKPHLTQAKRWQEVVTAFGIDVDRRAPVEEAAEAEPATMVNLLALARQFQAGDQSNALQLLRAPEVQAAAAVTAAVESLRAEARDELLKSLQSELTGKELGVLTVAQQREALSGLGVELPANLPSTEVTRRFNAHLDAAVAGVQPDATQRRAILTALGVDVEEGKADEAYDKLLTDGAAKARERAKGLGLSGAQTDALVAQFKP